MATWHADKTKMVTCPHCKTKGIVPVWIKPVDLPIKCYACGKTFRDKEGVAKHFANEMNLTERLEAE